MSGYSAEGRRLFARSRPDVTRPALGTGATKLLDPRPDRFGSSFFNASADPVFLKIGATGDTPTVTNFDYVVPPMVDGVPGLADPPFGAVDGWRAGAGSGALTVVDY